MSSLKSLFISKSVLSVQEISETFLRGEKYLLTNQIRKSYRVVCANFAEAYKERLYVAHFEYKLLDCDCENAETQVYLDFHLVIDTSRKKITSYTIDH